MIVAVDPGSRVLGLAALASDRGASPVGLRVLEQTVVKIRGTNIARLCAVGTAVRVFCAKHRPTLAAWEEGYIGANVQSGLVLAEIRGVVIYELLHGAERVIGRQRGDVLRTIGVDVPKLARGEADRVGAKEAARRRRENNDALKFAVRKRVQQLLGLKELPAEDAADALALGIAAGEVE